MTTTQKILSLLAAFLLVCVPLRAQSGQPATVTGKITADGEGAITYATVYLKGTARRAATDDAGRYRLQVPPGRYELIVTATGYKGAQRSLTLRAGERRQLDVRLEPNEQQLGEAVVTAGAVNRVNRSAFNAVAVDASALHNTTQNLSDVLAKAPGLKLRESGGVGSDMQFMMDGFSGRHVKVFIDGVPQEGVGAGFGLNNIPASYAERIEVYRGVVPVAFGTDALGGVVNIVTGRRPRPWHLDASYSYGSFNTHKSYVNFGQTFRSGLMYEINAFQNYSDNSYHIDTPVEHFMPDGSSSLDATRVEHVKRFHDTYHNEAVFGKVGFVGRSFADRLVLGFGYTHFYQEIQNGVIQKVVFGQKFRQGHSFMPSLEYRKRDLLTMGEKNVLVETRCLFPPMEMEGVLGEMLNAGYRPILAHPERYRYMDKARYRRIKGMGVKFQLNLGSAVGGYGKEARNKAEWLLEEGMYDLMGSDAHTLRFYDNMVSMPLPASVAKRIAAIPNQL